VTLYLADVGEDRRRRVLVVSGPRFGATAQRAVVVPEIGFDPDLPLSPWRVPFEETAALAVDRLTTVPTDVLHHQVGQLPISETQQVRRLLVRALTA
jgi:mRNA-degrading endonuclease toxin of MazEF toxin-antitoxin module